jgi:hypothetical protein
MGHLSTAHKVFAALAVIEGEKDLPALFLHGPSPDQASMEEYAGNLQERFSEGRTKELASLLRSWAAATPSFPLNEIHPGWILDAVRDESPRVIGLICRYLPGRQVRYLLENLPQAVRVALPTISESYRIPLPLVSQAKDFLSKRFFQVKKPSASEPFSCRHIPWMHSKDIERVIRELGYQEIRFAFAKLPAQTLRSFLTRFPLMEARHVKRALTDDSYINPEDRKRAQQHLTNVNFDVPNAEELPLEIGLSVLSQSVSPNDGAWAEALIYKIEPRAGYSFKRYVNEAIVHNSSERLSKRQAQLMGVIRELADQEEISCYWRKSREEETTHSQLAVVNGD